MQPLIIKTNDLSYTFSGGYRALDKVNIAVSQGSIYGFLGPNGAGKTTTLRLLLGLLRNQQGAIEVFGKNIASDRINILKNTGSLIEQPSLYGHLTAVENLDIYRRIMNVIKKESAKYYPL